MRSFFPFAGAGLSVLVAAALAVSSCNNNADNKADKDTVVTTPVDNTGNHITQDTTPAPLVNHAEAAITGTYSDTVVNGTVKFDADASGKVKMVLDITVPAKANKNVAVHLHEHGDCGDKGNMSHGHWNPTNAEHGKWGSKSFHLGDIGNVKLDGKGKGSLTLETDLWSLGGTPGKNILGKALIVHGGVDDYTTQPTGNAGSRIGCGVIK